MNTAYAKNKRLRRALMELLRTEYPGALDLKALQFALDSLGYPLSAERLGAHLSYLSEKGLVTLSERKGFGFRIGFASLSAAGWDVLDATGEDDEC